MDVLIHASRQDVFARGVHGTVCIHIKIGSNLADGLSFNVEVAGEFTGSCENRSIFNQKAHDNSFHGYMMRPGPRRGTGVS